MGRSNRGRSGSIGSDVCTKSSKSISGSFSHSPLPGAIEAASFLFRLALTLHDTECEVDQNSSGSFSSCKPCSNRTNFIHALMRHQSSSSKSRIFEGAIHEDIRLIDIFLQRASYLDFCNTLRSSPSQQSLLAQSLLQQDLESGYSPLHEACLGKNLLAILLMLRYSALRTLGPSPVNMMDYSPRWPLIHPMKLLDRPRSNNLQTPTSSTTHSRTSSISVSTGNSQSTDTILWSMVSQRDNEGLTPLQLLCRCFVSDFNKCRKSLSSWLDHGFQQGNDESMEGMSPTESVGRARPRSLSFQNLHHDHDSEEQSVDNSQNEDSSVTNEYTYGCEIMTFGKPDHCALGVPQGATSERSRIVEKDSVNMTLLDLNGASPSSVRPKRVETFALGEMGRDFYMLGSVADTVNAGPAVAIAAATHHSLVVTKRGHLYAFGLGKGGRLGTGNENHCPLPVRILGPLERRHVVAVSAAVNHSLCVTKDGAVYAWGQNGFGQLGIPKTGQANATVEQKFLPRRVEALRQSFILMVAAGERHSIALSKLGEVYVWGDNKNGQLGVAAPSESSNVGRDIYLPTRLNSLWSNRRFAISIAASEFSSLVLTRPYTPNNASMKINSVFEFGHGNHIPTLVVFPSYDESVPRLNQDIPRSYVTSMKTNPVAIACAKYHSVAITDDGRVYTWGLHSCDLGTSTVPSPAKPRLPSIGFEGEWEEFSNKGRTGTVKRATSAGTVSVASPQLVKGMLPEYGGGRAVQVAASENHTCVITDEGNLYTWGAAYGNDVLGHDGVKYVSTPLQVPGVHRAIGLASAREHTVLMLCTKFPPLPQPQVLRGDFPKLQDLATKIIAAHVDMFNVVPILNVAERIQNTSLIEFCNSFVSCNLDGVLSVGRKSEFESYLNDILSGHVSRSNDFDEKLHPLLHSMLRLKVSDVTGKTKHWANECMSLVDNIPAAALQKAHIDAPPPPPTTGSLPTQKIRKIAASENTDSYGNIESAQSALDSLSKEVRTIKKKIAQISELENLVNIDGKSLTPEQIEKVKRRPLFEADLHLLEPRLLDLTSKVKLFESLKGRVVINKNSVAEHQPIECSDCTNDRLGAKQTLLDKSDDSSLQGLKSHRCDVADKSVRHKSPTGDDQECFTRSHTSPKFFCSVCSVSCPDEKSYELHLNGRRHFNTYRHIQEKNVLDTSKNALVNEVKLIDSPDDHNAIHSSSQTFVWGKSSGLSVTPRYSLPPPSRISSETSADQFAKAPLRCDYEQVIIPKKSFQQIMEEEENKSSRVKSSSDQVTRKKTTIPNISEQRHATHFLSTTNRSPNHSINITHSDFSTRGLVPSQSRTPTSVWTKSDSPSITENSAVPSLKKSIYDIQQEEIKFKAKEDKGIVEGKWYVERRERAPSISVIQQEETEAKQFQILIEEQLKIEEQIFRDQKSDSMKKDREDIRHPRGKNRRKDGGTVKKKEQRVEKKRND